MNSSFNQDSGNNPQDELYYASYLMDRPTSAPPSLEYIQNTFGEETILMTPEIRGLPTYERFYDVMANHDPTLPVPYSYLGNNEISGYSLFGNVCTTTELLLIWNLRHFFN